MSSDSDNSNKSEEEEEEEEEEEDLPKWDKNNFFGTKKWSCKVQ
jgi:hypothetical protein